MIVGIDPSFKGTGLACSVKGKVVFTTKIKTEGNVYKDIAHTLQLCSKIALEVANHIEALLYGYSEKKLNIIIEYPAAQTRSGSTLNLLAGVLYSTLFKKFKIDLRHFYYIPPMACDAFVGNKSHHKSFLVDYVLKKGYVPKKVSHDEATAIIFLEIYSAIVKGTYKKSYFPINEPVKILKKDGKR